MHNTYNYKVQLENVDANNPGTLGCFYRKCNPDWWMCLGRVKKETYMYTYAFMTLHWEVFEKLSGLKGGWMMADWQPKLPCTSRASIGFGL